MARRNAFFGPGVTDAEISALVTAGLAEVELVKKDLGA
jgi:hypothetical protein